MEQEKLDELLDRVRGSALESLTAAVDVEERLRAIHRACDTERGAAGTTGETPGKPR